MSGPSLDPSLVGAATGHDPLLPTLGNGGYDVQSYDIAVETNPVDNQTTIRVVIEAVATQRLGRFSLDYSGVAPGSVRVDDTAAAFIQAGGKLTVTPSRVIDDGGTFRTAVDIAGRPSAVRGVGWAWRGAEQLSAFGIYDALPTWLPTNDDPADKAFIETHVTVPRPYTAVGRCPRLEDRRRRRPRVRLARRTVVAGLDRRPGLRGRRPRNGGRSPADKL